MKNDIEKIKEIVSTILRDVSEGKATPCKCIPISILIAGFLTKNDILSKVAYGNLKYNEKYLFKYSEGFDINIELEKYSVKLFDGHCWVEIDNKNILEASIFRTIYCSAEIEHNLIKQAIETKYGKNTGCYIFDIYNTDNFEYERIGYIKEEIIEKETSKFSEYMLQKNSNY